MTTLGQWRAGGRVNLERSLQVGDELGGHMVSGHVDGVAEILSRRDFDGMAHFRFRAPKDLGNFIAVKGSVALDGTSLTVNAVDGDAFEVLLIPHTLEVTTWGERKAKRQGQSRGRPFVALRRPAHRGGAVDGAIRSSASGLTCGDAPEDKSYSCGRPRPLGRLPMKSARISSKLFIGKNPELSNRCSGTELPPSTQADSMAERTCCCISGGNFL